MATIGHTAPRVLIADDSAFMRRLVRSALVDGGFDVVGEAGDGDEALAACRSERPDVLTLDLAMPGRDGLSVLRALRGQDAPPRVVVVSGFSSAANMRAVDALVEGAFDVVRKPETGRSAGVFSRDLCEKVSAAARALARAARRASGGAPSTPVRRRSAPAGTGRLVVIAASTGGPNALAQVVPRLPSPLGCGAVLVQHMPMGFTASLAARLDGASALNVREAAFSDTIDPTTLLIAPGGRHLRLRSGGVARLSSEEPVGGLRPFANFTIGDAAKTFGERVLLVVMTGMGSDGLDGARKVREAGGRVIVQSEETCTVYGMPRAVAEAGLADATVALERLPTAIASEAVR